MWFFVLIAKLFNTSVRSGSLFGFAHVCCLVLICKLCNLSIRSGSLSRFHTERLGFSTIQLIADSMILIALISLPGSWIPHVWRHWGEDGRNMGQVGAKLAASCAQDGPC